MTFHDLSDIGVEGEEREKTKNKQQTTNKRIIMIKQKREKREEISYKFQSTFIQSSK